MKRIVQLGGMLIALGMLFASCQMGTSDASFSGNSAEQESSNISGITIGVKSIDNSRTILPADWTTDRAKALTYVLWAKKTGGGTGYEPKETFSYDQLTNGTAKVNLELTYWDLKLVGYMTSSGETAGEEGSEDDGAPCLAKELLNVDFTTGAKSVTFDLKPALTKEDGDPTDATGSVNVSIAWLTKQPKRIELGIYASGTSTETIVKDKGRSGVANANDSGNTPLKKILVEGNFGAAGGNANLATLTVDDTVKAGMYKFAAVFYDNNDDTTFTGKVIGYYIDWLYVDGGNLTQASINYGDKFNTIPDNPTWLAVKTFFEPEQLKAGETAKTTYLAEFHWNDNSTNETGFELVITDNATPPNEYVVNTDTFKTSDEKNGDLVPSDEEIETLSPTLSAEKNTLDAGSTSVVLKLETEKLYTAKIRAINEFTPETSKATGEKDFCKNLNRNGDGQGRSYAPIVGTEKQFGMFTVSYTLDEGSVVVYGKESGDKTKSDTEKYVVGYNYSDQQQNLMTDHPQEYPHISKDANKFDHWTNTADSLDLEVIAAKHTENLTLEPNWTGIDVYVSVTLPSYAVPADIKLVANMNEAKVLDSKWVNSTTPIATVYAGESLSDVGFELTYYLDGTEITEGTDGSTTTFKWQTTEAPKAGIYCLQITGTYTDTQGSGRKLTLCGNVYINVMN